MRLNNLGVALKHRHELRGDQDDLDRGRAALQSAYQEGVNGDVRWALAAALTLGRWAVEREEWTEAAQAFDDAMRTANRYLDVQLRRASVEAALVQLGAAAPEAAEVLSHVGRLADAVLAVERGRAVVLSRALELDNSRVDRLSAQRMDDLAARFRAAAAQLARVTP